MDTHIDRKKKYKDLTLKGVPMYDTEGEGEGDSVEQEDLHRNLILAMKAEFKSVGRKVDAFDKKIEATEKKSRATNRTAKGCIKRPGELQNRS